MSLTINVATVYPKEILSPWNSVARMLVIICTRFSRWHHESAQIGRIASILLKQNLSCFLFARDCLRRRATSFVVKEGLLFYNDKESAWWSKTTLEYLMMWPRRISNTFLNDVIALNLVVVTLNETRRCPKYQSYWRGMVDNVKGFARRAKEQTSILHV